MIKKIFKIFIIIILFFIIAFFGTIKLNENNIIKNESIDNYENRIKVKYVSSIDGDTAKFVLNGDNVKIRFIGINAPEIKHDENEESEPYGDEASLFVKNLLENAKKIEIEYEKNASVKDKYDRVLAWIWVDDKLIQEEIISNGLAKTYMLQKNYKYYDKLKNAERKAKEKKIYLWN